MKVTTVSSTNNRYNYPTPIEGTLSAGYGCMIFYDGARMFSGYRTSLVEKIIVKDNEITVHTLNSVYKYKSIDDTPDWTWTSDNSFGEVTDYFNIGFE